MKNCTFEFPNVSENKTSSSSMPTDKHGEVVPPPCDVGGGVLSVNVKTPLVEDAGVIARHEADVGAVQYTACALNGPEEIVDSTLTEKLDNVVVAL